MSLLSAEVDSPLEPPLEIVEEEPEESAPVDPSRRLKKSRTFSEYTRLWRASEDGPQPATAELPLLPPVKTLVAPPPLASPLEAQAPIANGHHPLEATGGLFAQCLCLLNPTHQLLCIRSCASAPALF